MDLEVEQITVPGEPGSPALALVNSRHASPAGWMDHIATPEALSAWLAQRGLTGGGAAMKRREVEVVQDLREAVREVLVARIERRPPSTSAVDRLNAAAQRAPLAPTLRWDAGAQRLLSARVAPPDAPWLATIQATIAADAIDLVTGDGGDALVACGGPRCVRLLLKDHPRRQWCSTRCGDRIRAGRYYARHRKAKADTDRR